MQLRPQHFLDAGAPLPLIPGYQPAGRPLPVLLHFGSRARVEESPGSMDERWRLTAAGGDPRDSATEIKPPTAPGNRGYGQG